MKRILILFAALSWPFAASDARADSFTVAPDGGVVLNSTLTTTGVFTCKLSNCSGSGTNSVTFTNGMERATITFTGVTTSLHITNHFAPLSLGVFEATSTPGFVFPERTNVYWPVVHFALFSTHDAPLDHTFRKGWSFAPGGDVALPVLRGTAPFAFAIPEGFDDVRYRFVIYRVRPFTFALPREGSLNLTGEVAMAPEPATLVLLGSGLAGIAFARRRRRG